MSTGSQSSTVSNPTATLNRSLRSTLQEFLILGVAVGWILFWGMIALTHFERNAMTSTFMTGVGLTLPVALTVLYRYGKRRYDRA